VQEARTLDGWPCDGLHADMAYMKNHFDFRTDPRKLVPDAKSVISLACSSFHSESQPEDAYKISRHACGRDYHAVIREKRHRLFEFIRTITQNPSCVMAENLSDAARFQGASGPARELGGNRINLP
jgi:epoxyqueuosine reductase QueG